MNGEIWQRNYQKYLQTEHWQEIRREVWERDRHKCQYCGREIELDQMQCHHLSYRKYNRRGFAFPQECITLCRGCHAKAHGHKSKDDTVYDSVLAKLRNRKATP